MRQLILASLVLLTTLPMFGQSATINAPTAGPTATKIVVVDFSVKRDCVCAYVVTEKQDAGGNPMGQVRYDVPDPAFPSATLQGLVGAMATTRATETGTNTRKMSFRILGYLFDNGYLSGVTLAP